GQPLGALHAEHRLPAVPHAEDELATATFGVRWLPPLWMSGSDPKDPKRWQPPHSKTIQSGAEAPLWMGCANPKDPKRRGSTALQKTSKTVSQHRTPAPRSQVGDGAVGVEPLAVARVHRGQLRGVNRVDEAVGVEVEVGSVRRRADPRSQRQAEGGV